MSGASILKLITILIIVIVCLFLINCESAKAKRKKAQRELDKMVKRLRFVTWMEGYLKNIAHKKHKRNKRMILFAFLGISLIAAFSADMSILGALTFIVLLAGLVQFSYKAFCIIKYDEKIPIKRTMALFKRNLLYKVYAKHNFDPTERQRLIKEIAAKEEEIRLLDERIVLLDI